MPRPAPHPTFAAPAARRGLALLAVLALPMAGACAGAQDPATPAPAVAAPRDTLADPTLIPAGFGTLRQDDIAVRLELGQLSVKVLPLDESIIRTLSPDSYRTLHDIVESRRDRLEQAARRRGLQRYTAWMVTFFALQPDVPYQPQELVLINNGREYRPIDVLPLNAGFGGPRLRQRETQAAIYLFDGSMNLQQPITVQLESGRSDVWQQVIGRVERERALVRSRATQQLPSGVAPTSPTPPRPSPTGSPR